MPPAALTVFTWLALLIDAGFAFWNARAVGLAWEASKVSGGLGRKMMWAGAIQSAVGFSAIYLYLLTGVLKARHILPPDAEHLIHGLFYAVIILPVLGAGFFIAIQRAIDFRDDQDTFSGYRALGASMREAEGVGSLVNATFGPPRVSDSVGTGGTGSGGSSRKDGGGVILAILVVGIAVFAGVLTTYLIIAFYSVKLPGDRPITPLRREMAAEDVRHRARQIF